MLLVVVAVVLGACAPSNDDRSAGSGSDDASPAFTAPPVTPARKPLLIKHGWDVPEPEHVRANAGTIDALPFDGITVALPDDLSSQVQGRTPLGRSTLRSALAPLVDADLSNVTHNFVMAYSAPAGDLFDDWSVPVQNFADLAVEARAAGLEGIFYDIEEYFGDALRYPESCAGRAVEECRQQARLRGREVMTAISEAWPDARLLTTFGPWLSEPLTAENLPGVAYDDVSWANELSGSFVVGLVEATVGTGTSAQVVDGGEVYTPRTVEQFTTVRAWVEHGMPALSPLIPDELRPVWADRVSAAFGVYDQPWNGADMDAETWGTTLAAALATTERYVWAYTERHDWLGTGWPDDPVPDEWVRATRTARH